MPQRWRRGLINKPGLGATINWGHPLATNLLAAYLFNEGGGSVVTDLVGGRNPLSFVNGGGGSSMQWGNVPGPGGGDQAVLDGGLYSGGLVNTTPTSQVLPTDQVSIFWCGSLVNVAIGGNNPSIVACTYNAEVNSSPYYAYYIGRPNGTQFYFADDTGGSANFNLVSAPVFSAGQRMSLAYTVRSGAQAAYVNGRLAGSYSHAGSLAYGAAPYLYAALPLAPSGNSQNSNASFSAFYIWRKVLTPDAIEWLNSDPFALIDDRKPRFSLWFGENTAKTLMPGGILSSCVLGEPNIVGPPRTLLPGGITSSCVLGEPTFSFPNIVQPGGILSSCVLGEPTMVGEDQTLVVSGGIPSSCVLAEPTMLGGSAQTVSPAGILSSCVLGEPAIAGGLSTIVLMQGIPSSCVVGTPALTGGNTGLTLFIANNPIRYLVPAGLTWPRQGGGGAGGGTGVATGGALTITQTAIGRATCSFDLFVDDASGYVPRASQTIIIQENGRKLFAGCLKNVSSDPAPGWGLTSTSPIGFHIDAVDKSSICDNRVVIKTYPVGTDVQGMILDIVANFLNGEGITTQGVDVTDTLDSAMVFNTVSVSNAFDQITSLTGAQWWVDFNGELHFVVIQTSPAAPFGLTATSGNFRNVVTTETTMGYANKFYAISNLTVLPGGAQGQSSGGAITGMVNQADGSGYNIGDTLSLIGGNNDAVITVATVGGSGQLLTWTITNPGTGYQALTSVTSSAITGTGVGFIGFLDSVSPPLTGASGAVRTETYTFLSLDSLPYQQAAFDAGLAPGYVLLNLPIAALISVSVNGTTIPVYPLSSGFQPGGAYYWFDGDAQAAVIFPYLYLPSIGDVIVVGYIPVYQNSSVQIGTPLSGTCGSGLVEGVIQVPNIDVQSQLDAIAAAYLQRNGTIPFLVSYETDYPGLFVGQQQSVDWPLVGLGSTTIYITSVVMSIETLNEGAAQMPAGSAFRYVIEATTQQNLGNWITWFERFIARTNYPLPLPRYEQGIAVLAPGGSLAGGTVITNTYQAKNAGTIFAASAQAQVAPVGQNLMLQWLINGTPLLITPIIIPAGSTDTVYATDAQIPSGATIFKGDLLTVVATYQTTTLSPTAAGSVSFYLEWSY